MFQFITAQTTPHPNPTHTHTHTQKQSTWWKACVCMCVCVWGMRAERKIVKWRRKKKRIEEKRGEEGRKKRGKYKKRILRAQQLDLVVCKMVARWSTVWVIVRTLKAQHLNVQIKQKGPTWRSCKTRLNVIECPLCCRSLPVECRCVPKT